MSIDTWKKDLVDDSFHISSSSLQSWSELPPVVKRYLQKAIQTTDDHPTSARLVQATTFSQVGVFQTQPTNPWTSFTANQVISANPPGFVWDASVALFPWLPKWPTFQVCDAWAHGKGILKVSLLKVVDVLLIPKMKNSPDQTQRIDKALEIGESLRWLAESFLVPTSMLPGQGLLAWSSVLDQGGDVVVDQARLYLQDPFQPFVESLVITFDKDSDMPLKIEGYRPKWDNLSNKFVMVDWVGFLEDFRTVRLDETTSLRLPFHLQVGWINAETGALELYFDAHNHDVQLIAMEDNNAGAYEEQLDIAATFDSSIE